MELQDFIEHYVDIIDSTIIQLTAIEHPEDINDDERELWILNDEGLYRFAQSEGVDI